jgi:hypothetical protein
MLAISFLYRAGWNQAAHRPRVRLKTCPAGRIAGPESAERGTFQPVPPGWRRRCKRRCSRMGGAQIVGKASRRHQEARVQGHSGFRPRPGARAVGDPVSRGQAVLARLVRTNQPGKVSLAGAYAFGYGAIGLARQEGDQP